MLARHKFAAAAAAEQLHSSELEALPDFVAEIAIAIDAQHVQVDVATLLGVGEQGETQRVRTAFGNTAGEVLRLTGTRALNLPILRDTNYLI